MVSLRCKLLVKAELENLGLKYVVVDLGVVEFMEDITPYQREQLRINLLRCSNKFLSYEPKPD